MLELGIGTGRIALPLAATGVVVHGIDSSETMIGRLREKPGGESIVVTNGTFERIGGPERYRLVFAAFSTIYCLTSQDQQIACFQSVADHLAPGGLFAIEGFIFDASRFARRQRVSVGRIEPDRLVLEAAEVDVPRQRLRYHHAVLGDSADVRLIPVSVRFAWPSELDLMARLAGLRLRHRWGSWRGSPLTRESTHHVSIYERPDDGC